MNAKETETIDELRAYNLRAIQPRNGYRFSLDPLLLCDFATVRKSSRVIDLGTGCGIIPMVLSRKMKDAHIVGIEFQREMADLAARNAALNGLEERIEVVCEDILSLRKRYPVSSFDLVIANPPYRTSGSGRVSPKAGRDLARHESSAGLADFLSVAKYLVKPGGSMCFIYHVSRLTEFFEQAIDLNLAFLRICMVHGHPSANASMVLIELAKGRKNDLDVVPPLFVNDTNGEYSSEMKRILETLHD